MKNVIPFQPKPSRVSLIRSRDKVLQIILPKFLGILWECGTLDGGASEYRKVTAIVEGDIELGAIVLGYGRYCLHAYASTARSRQDKVFSVHIGDPSITDPAHFRYLSGRCGVLGWKRGQWEDRIAAHTAESRTVAHVLTAGLTRSKTSNG